MPKHINTYHKGMDRDSSPNNYGEGRYYDARNFRRLSENDMSAGAMNNMLGNTFKKTLPNEYLVIGSCPIRDLTVIFATKCTTDNPGGVDPDLSADPSSLGRIYTTNLNDAVPTLTLIKEDYYNFTTKHPIYAQAIGRYERSTLQKVYWVDGFNLFRGMNLSDPPTNPDQIDIVPSVSFSQPYMTNTGSGELKVGRIQFAYQLYNLSGAESKLSPASPLYNLTNSNYNSATDIGFEGTSKLNSSGDLSSSGMSITVKIDNIDTTYDKIKLVSVHYNTVDSTPTISIVAIKDIKSSISITDTGVYDLGTITLNEFRTLGGLLIIPKTIDVKDNMLFAANIKTKYFDVDFDTRAYRWRTTDNIAHILDVGSSYDTYDKVSGSWPTATYAFKGVTNDLIPEDHNCINPFNYDPVSNTYMESSSYTANWAACKYQSDNATLGGEGPNVRYSFGNDINFYANNELGRYHKVAINKNAVSEGGSPEDIGNPIGSFDGYSNPYNAAHYLGYKRDEIYRFGIVFFNNRGQESFVKWIGDVRTPTIYEFPLIDIYDHSGSTKTFPLYIYFEVDTSSLSDDVVGYRIVRVKRNQEDKTIMSSGAISHTHVEDVRNGFLDINDNIFPDYDVLCPVAIPREKSPAGTGGVEYTERQDIHSYITPEESYYRNYKYSSGDYIKLVSQLQDRWCDYYRPYASATKRYKGYWTSINENVIDFYFYQNLMHKYALSIGLSTQMTYDILEGRSFAPRKWENILSPGDSFGSSGDIFVNYGVGKDLIRQSSGPSSTSILIETTDISDSYMSGTDPFTLYYVDYKSNNANAIYGGIEYTDRELNEYIPAGNYIDLTRLKGTDTGGANLKIYDASIIDLYPVGSLVGGVVINLDTGLSGDITVHAASELTTTIFFNNNSYLIIPPEMNLTYVFGGDTYICMFDTARTMFPTNRVKTSESGDIKINAANIVTMNLVFPCESSINLDIDHGWTFSRNSNDAYGDDPYCLLQEEEGVHKFDSENTTNILNQDSDLYLYNSVYSQQDTSKIFLSRPSDWVEITESDTTIMQSDVKVNNEQIDSWLKFRTENYIDVENSYGPINRLLRWNNYMIFFQDIGVGTVSINERQLIPIENNSALELGRGGVLDRFDMIATGIGCRHKEAVLATEFGFYWYDVQKKAMYYYSNALQNISDVAGLFSEFKNIPDTFYDHTNTIDGNGIMLTKNKRYDEVWLSFVESAGYNDTFIYNEMFKQFIGSTDHDAKIFLNTTRGLFALKNMRDIYEENTGNYGQFFGSTYNSTLTLIINPNGDIVDVFNNFNFLSDLHDSGGTEVIDETFTDVQQLNSYQDSGVVSFVVPTNIRRRMRTWRFNDMRDSSARFRDSYLKMILRFTNSSNRKFVMHPMNTIYIVPAESITP